MIIDSTNIKIKDNKTAIPNNNNIWNGSLDIILNKRKGMSLIPIQPEGDLPPFFAIPGFFFYQKVATYLGKEQPFYGFEPSKFKKTSDIAKAYIQELKTIQPKGPYYLGGFCLAGNIAFEMAQQLTLAGEKVNALVLFESYGPKGFISKKSFKYISQKITSYFIKFHRKEGLEKFNFLKEEWTKVSNKLTNKKKEEMASDNYSFLPYSGKLILFKASEPTVGVNEAPYMGWEGLAKEGFEMLVIKGDHDRLFEEPYVIEVAQKLKGVLKDSRI